MNESKSKIMSFRLSVELEALASAAAASAGDRNASAWCQRLAVEALSKIGEANQNENAERSLESSSVNDLLKAFGNVRQLALDCFKMSLKNEEEYKKFLKIVIASEEQWEAINQSIGKQKLEISVAASELTPAYESPGSSASFGKQEEAPEDQTVTEVISNEYLLFAEEMKNEISELVGDEKELAIFQNGRAIESGESAIKNQVPLILPILDATGQTDIGKNL